MHPNQRLLTDFYAAFAARDGATMAAAYTADARFSDPVFPELIGPQIGAMWTMLTSRAKDFALTVDEITADDDGGRVRWQARYLFSATGRKVLNRVVGTFQITGGKISRHDDRFPFWTWSRQALGPSGLLLGWTPIVQNKVRAQAAANLAAFSAKSA